MVRYELPTPPSLQPAQTVDAEPLRGEVNGKRASDLEEYFARGLWRESRVEFFYFRMIRGAPSGMFGSAELDFYIKAGSWYPVQIDQDWLHKSAAARAQDQQSDATIWQSLRNDAPAPISRIKGTLIKTPDRVDRVIDQLLMGRVFTPETSG